MILTEIKCTNCRFFWQGFGATKNKNVCTFRDGLPEVNEDEHCMNFEENPLLHVIADSGDRTQFESGAVRDMHQGKGRCDLLPMCVMLRLAKHYEAGAIKYSDRNWEQGIPAHSFADSALRHMFKYMDGQKDEDHLIAAIWNLCGLAWTEEKKPEMMDIPARQEVTE